VRTAIAEISRLLRLLAAQAAIVLFTSQTKVLGVLIYDLNESGDLAAISVLGIMMLVITLRQCAITEWVGMDCLSPSLRGAKRRRFHGEWIATESEARLRLQNHSTWRQRCCSIIFPTD
jgi:hypothetical protein